MKIDVHHHYLPQAFFDRIEELLPPEIAVKRAGSAITLVDRADGYIYLRLEPRIWSDVRERLEAMDAAGIDHAILSSSCFQDWMTLAAARVINDGTAELVKAHPARFSGMISIPPDGGAAMIEEIRRAHALGLCAINISATHKDRYPDHEAFRLLLRVAADMDLPVFVHPSFRGPVREAMGQWSLERSIGKPHDMALGIARLVYCGAMSELPGLRLVLGHLGGDFPLLRRRLFFGPEGVIAAPKQDYDALLQRVFFDTAPSVWQSPAEVECAAKLLGAGQLMLGSDYPMSSERLDVLRMAVDHVEAAEIDPHDQERVLSATAMGVFKLGKSCDC